MKLFFKHSNNMEELLLETENKEELIDKINDFLYKKKYKTYYTRVWEENGRLKIDFGSWSEFFFVDGFSLEEWFSKK